MHYLKYPHTLLKALEQFPEDLELWKIFLEKLLGASKRNHAALLALRRLLEWLYPQEPTSGKIRRGIVAVSGHFERFEFGSFTI